MTSLKKNSSPALEHSQTRLAALATIDPALDLDNGLTLAVYQAAIQDAQNRLSAYNALLSQVDEARKNLRANEKELRSLSERMLAGVTAKYGKDSSEYKMAGGTRKSEIKRPAKKKAVATAPDPAGDSK